MVVEHEQNVETEPFRVVNGACRKPWLARLPDAGLTGRMTEPCNGRVGDSVLRAGLTGFLAHRLTRARSKVLRQASANEEERCAALQSRLVASQEKERIWWMLLAGAGPWWRQTRIGEAETGCTWQVPLQIRAPGALAWKISPLHKRVAGWMASSESRAASSGAGPLIACYVLTPYGVVFVSRAAIASPLAGNALAPDAPGPRFHKRASLSPLIGGVERLRMVGGDALPAAPRREPSLSLQTRGSGEIPTV